MLRHFQKSIVTLIRISHSKSVNLNVLGKRISDQNEKLKTLHDLLAKNQLMGYFKSKEVEDFSVQEIYFYLNNMEMFTPPNKIIKASLIGNPHLTASERFSVAAQVRFLPDNITQLLLIQSFNQGVRQMSSMEIAYCLTQLANFFEEELLQKINIGALRDRLAQDESFGIEYLQVLSSVIDLNLAENVLARVQCVAQIEKFQGKVFEKCQENSSLRELIFLQKAEKYFKVKINPSETEKRVTLIKKLLNSSPIDSTVKILSYYPDLVPHLKISRLEPVDYNIFLDIMQSLKREDENFVVPQHQIPRQLLLKVKHEQFYLIIGLRIKLGLDTPEDLIRKIKSQFTRELQPLSGLIRYFSINQIYDDYIWANLQKIILAKLHFNNKKYTVEKILQEYEISGILKVLANISMSRMGSTDFWQASLRFVYNFLLMPDMHKTINFERQNVFIIYIYQIYLERPMPKLVDELMKNLTLVALSKNKWLIAEINSLCYCLSRSRIGDDEIWYALESKIIGINMNKNFDIDSTQKLRKIYLNFKRMKKGSFRFMNKMGKFQSVVTSEEKEAILSRLEKDN